MNSDKTSWLWIALVVGLVLARQQGCDLAVGSPSPIADSGLRVLITFPEATRDELPVGQKALLVSPSLRDWLDAHCTKDGTVPEWRIEPDSIAFGPDQPLWQKLMAAAVKDFQGKGPWLVVADGKHGLSQPLPADEASLLAALQPFGGAP